VPRAWGKTAIRKVFAAKMVSSSYHTQQCHDAKSYNDDASQSIEQLQPMKIELSIPPTNATTQEQPPGS